MGYIISIVTLIILLITLLVITTHEPPSMGQPGWQARVGKSAAVGIMAVANSTITWLSLLDPKFRV